MKRVTLAAVLLCCSWVAAEEPNAIARVTAIYAAAEERDAVAVAAGLDDPRWYVRRFALVRLRALGLPDAAFEPVQESARPGAQGKPSAEALAVCRDWAGSVAKDATGAVFKPAALDAVQAIASILEEEFRFVRNEPNQVRGLLAALLALLHDCPGKVERAWLATRVLADLEGERVLLELGLQRLPEDDKELSVACDRMQAWFAANAAYHYYHPGERRLRLDEAARTAQTPTDDFRKAHPWGEKEGPNAPGVSPGPVR